MEGIGEGINKDVGENAHFENFRGAYPIFSMSWEIIKVGGSKVSPYLNRSSIEQAQFVREGDDPLLKFGQKNEMKVNKNVFLYLSPYHSKKLVIDIKILGRGMFFIPYPHTMRGDVIEN